MSMLQIISDAARGQTTILSNELLKSVPFEIQRMFLITDVPRDVVRGSHAHYKEKQYIFCISGVLEIIQEFNSGCRLRILKGGDGLYHPELTWVDMEFKTGNEIVLVLSSAKEYDTSDYIYDYEEFKKIIGA
jgi:UDP-2-acetamido-3-amino-2,3-dideoxy-glucuronate N-acetyltransferase